MLTRCKKLNEFLSSDFLAPGSADSKAQLSEMLAILNGPKQRPAFLDKPSVLDTAGKKSRATPDKSKQTISCLSGFSDQLLDLLEESEKIENTAMKPSVPPTQIAVSQHDQEDGLDDLIGLLNPDAMPTRNEEDERLQCQREEQARLKAEAEKEEQAKRDQERQEEEERQRQKKQGEEKARLEEQKRAEQLKREEEGRLKKAEEDMERERREAERQQRLQQEAKDRKRREEEAALVIQSCSRRHLAIHSAERLRKEAAALVIQTTFRALMASRRLHLLRSCQRLCQKRAARIISDSFLEYKRRWRLNTIKAPGSFNRRDSLDGHSHLLKLPVRVRNASDLRSAPDASSGPEASGSSSCSMDHSASGRRTVESARKRVVEVGGSESRLRDAESERRLKAASTHRDFAQAFTEVKKTPIARQAHKASNSKPPVPKRPSTKNYEPI